ncbi:MAG: DUF2017 family protein [Acidimicrobiales bacterium]
MPFFAKRHFVRNRDGTYKLRLDPEERALLATLPGQLEALLQAADPGVAGTRLFPPAYPSDAQRDAEYQRLMRDELVRRRLSTLAIVRDTVATDQLTADELDAWARAINDARLVLGTLLDVSEDEDPMDVDPDAPDAHQRVAYVVLSGLVADAVDALAGV